MEDEEASKKEQLDPGGDKQCDKPYTLLGF